MRRPLEAAPAATSRSRLQHVDRLQAPAYSSAMSQGNDMLTELREISGQLDRLLELCQRLTEENRSLRISQEQLSNERSNLLAKNEQARSRVEAMIARLRSLENNA
jgi:cell division protein ZapB